MKIVYIAHPIASPSPKENIDKILKIIRHINLTEPDVVPFAPYIPDCLCMDDHVPAERERGIKNDIALIKAGFITEARLYGPVISKGMQAEKELFESLGVPVIILVGASVCYDCMGSGRCIVVYDGRGMAFECKKCGGTGQEQIQKKSRCCGRCDGVNELCYVDMICEEHSERGCRVCWPDPE